MPIFEDLKNKLSEWFGDISDRKVKELQPRVEEINALEEDIEPLSDDELAAKTEEFKQRLEDGETLDDLLNEAFAVVREVAKRTLGQRHYDVQIMGGIVIHEGAIAEMKTGEGKTLASTAPVYLNALSGKGVHVVTVNDYLARRDAVWMGQIFNFLGLSVGVIGGRDSFLYDPTLDETYEPEDEGSELKDPEDKERDEEGYYKVVYEYLRECERPEAYEADITYGTNNQFGFDYLRDHLSYDPDKRRQRGHNFAIIDEIDSILIDEARTPLIISAPDEESGKLYATFAQIARGLKEGEEEGEGDYTVDEEKNAVMIHDSGVEKAEQALGIDNIYTDAGVKYVHHLETAVKAKALYKKDQEYVVKDNQVMIIDKFTGRILDGRRYSEGLHQAIEAKEGVKVQRESKTYASITFQNFFRMYDKLSGMTGTAVSSSEEFFKVYDLDTFAIPTNKPIQRVDHDDLIFQSEEGKFMAIAQKLRELKEKGQPVLVGTVTVEKNEALSSYLLQEGIDHEVLNAKNHEREGEITAQAGAKGAVTLATNMAGRGVDIKLGGADATEEEYEEVKELGGLFVLGTERHDARRIDDQLRGRAGRQGDPGESRFYVSLDDKLMRVFASDTVKNMMGRFGIPEDQPIENPLISRSLETAQKKIEGFNFDARRHVLKFDDVLNTQRTTIYETRDELLEGGPEELDAFLEEVADGDEAFKETVEEKKQDLGEETFYDGVRKLSLQTIDTLWVEHLQMMDHMRSSVNLRAYGQEDPLVEYKKEGLRMFNDMQEAIDEQIKKMVPKMGEGAFEAEKKNLKEVHEKADSLSESGGAEASSSQEDHEPVTSDAPTHNDGTEIGRNDRVVIVRGGDEKTMKYKKAERLIEDEGWTLAGSARDLGK